MSYISQNVGHFLILQLDSKMLIVGGLARTSVIMLSYHPELLFCTEVFLCVLIWLWIGMLLPY